MWRPIIIMVVCVLGAVAAFYVLRERLQRQVVNEPYIVAIKTDLETVRAAEGTYRAANGTYARELRLDPSPGVHTRIVAASADGFLAEGRSDSWGGRCLLALGSFAGDSLKAGEPKCYSS